MRHRTRILVYAAAAILTAPATVRATDPPPDRLWPVPLAPGVASSFCEYRDGHLHAGLDVRTYGREGIECLAAADGWVSRVRATPSGYGEVVYLLIDSGETLVYAHLSEFSPRIDSMVVAEQRRAGRYSVDFRVPPGTVRVRRGDVVAYSGSTGGVDPHLHFEVRNHNEHPLDPFSRGFALEDTLRPAIERVVFVPLQAGARVDGACYPAEFEAVSVGPGRFAIRDTIAVDGGVGLEVGAVDFVNAESGRLAPRLLEVSVDGEPVSRIEFKAFSFEHAGEIGFVYDVGRVWTKRQYLYQLYERSGESLWSRQFVDGGRLLGDSPADEALHELRVRVADSAGNESELVATLVHTRRDAGRARVRRWEGELPGWFFLGGVASRDDTPGADTAGVWGAGPGQAAAAGSPFFLAGVRAGEDRSVRVPGYGLEVDFSPRTLYGDAVVYAARPTTPERSREGDELVSRTPEVQIGPYSLALRSDVRIRFAVPGCDSSDAVYRQSPRSGKWVYYASDAANDTVSTAALRPGVYAVFSDRTPPRIAPPVVSRRTMHATGERLPQLVVPIEDTGSGVDYDRCAIFLAGIEQIARWDLSSRKFFVLLRDENIMGPQALTVVAYDNIGHRSQLDTTVDIPRRTRR